MWGFPQNPQNPECWFELFISESLKIFERLEKQGDNILLRWQPVVEVIQTKHQLSTAQIHHAENNSNLVLGSLQEVLKVEPNMSKKTVRSCSLAKGSPCRYGTYSDLRTSENYKSWSSDAFWN